MLKFNPSALRCVVFTSLTFLKVLMFNFKQTLLATCVSLVVLNANADPVQQVTNTGDNARTEQQLIGDTNASENKINSTSTQLGNSANANGATITTGVDTRDQNTNTVNSSGGAGGSATGNSSANDNRSQVGNTSSNSVSNAASNSGGNNLSNEGVKSTIGASIAGSNTSANRTSSQGGMSTSSASGGQGGYSSAKGGSSQQGQQQSADNSGNSSTSSVTNNNVDAANRSVYNSRAIAFAPVIHGQSSAPVGVGNTTVIHRKCGTRLNLIRTPIYAHTIGAFSGVSSFPYAYTETTSPAGQPFIKTDTDFGTVLMGHEAYITEKTLGTSSSTSFSIGGFGSNGGGQGGSQGSGSLTQSIKQVEIFECIYAIQQVVEVKPVAHPVVEFNQVETEVTRPKQDRN